MHPIEIPSNLRIAKRFLIKGSVQGIGFRPALARLASSLNLTGTIANSSQGVELYLEGEESDLETFANQCMQECPIPGRVQQFVSQSAELVQTQELRLLDSHEALSLGTQIPVDRVCCAACQGEVLSHENRRFSYMLNACSECGPRYTIIRRMPFERIRTAYQPYEMCEACRAEYVDPCDRRYHSQGIACANCGPQFQRLEQAIKLLRDGNIVAIKGVGGYQLIADATNQQAVEDLRARKDRLEKPFVVMVAGIDQARQLARLTSAEESELVSMAGPIVLVDMPPTIDTEFGKELDALDGLRPLAYESITRGLKSIGLMLPTTPLHHWLVTSAGPLVVTSANVEGDPIVISDREMAESHLVRPDQILTHNREILRQADDSVVRVLAGQPRAIRLGRGMAPLCLAMDGFEGVGSILAVGGHQKVAIAFTNGYQCVLGPHIGDMGGVKSRERFMEHVKDLLDLYGCTPDLIVHDLHPDYFTTQWATEYAKSKGIKALAVQHHHAHLASGAWEAGWIDRPFLGIAWDGSGYGTDQTVWGGEAFRGQVSHWDRVASLVPFVLPGGEAAIYEPDRIAESLLWQTYGDTVPIESLGIDRGMIHKMIRQRVHSPTTTSVGRLFDGVAALVFGGSAKRKSNRVGYEGHWAMLWESLCDGDTKKQIASDEGAGKNYPMPLIPPDMSNQSMQYQWDWRPMIKDIVDDIRRHASPSSISFQFHRTLAHALVSLVDCVAVQPLLLSGGVFQNKVLVEMVGEICDSRGIEWFLPSKIPFNDGGLAAGQLLMGLLQKRGQLCV
ncbi:carbamoyltransferase HypF [Pirellulaceae bacterium SH449]